MPNPMNDGASPRVSLPAPALRHVVVALLALATVLTLVVLPALRTGVAAGRWPRAVLAIPPALVGAFICGYALYRFALVRAGRYPAGKALVQLGLMLLALGLVVGMALDPSPLVRRGRLERAMRSDDPGIRALAAEVVRARPREAVAGVMPQLVELLADRDPDVRREAHESLVAVAGEDLGGPEAIARWRERFPATR